MLILKLLIRIIKIIQSGPTPAQAAAGFTLGMFIGLAPFSSLYTIFIAILILLLNINISAAILGWIVFSIIGFFADALFHSIGYSLLTSEGYLNGIWTAMANTPIIPLTAFNNTVNLGSICFSIILAIPIYFGFKTFIVIYRSRYAEKLANTKVIKSIKLSKPYIWYTKYSNLRGNN